MNTKYFSYILGIFAMIFTLNAFAGQQMKCVSPVSESKYGYKVWLNQCGQSVDVAWCETAPSGRCDTYDAKFNNVVTIKPGMEWPVPKRAYTYGACDNGDRVVGPQIVGLNSFYDCVPIGASLGSEKSGKELDKSHTSPPSVDHQGKTESFVAKILPRDFKRLQISDAAMRRHCNREYMNGLSSIEDCIPATLAYCQAMLKCGISGAKAHSCFPNGEIPNFSWDSYSPNHWYGECYEEKIENANLEKITPPPKSNNSGKVGVTCNNGEYFVVGRGVDPCGLRQRGIRSAVLLD